MICKLGVAVRQVVVCVDLFCSKMEFELQELLGVPSLDRLHQCTRDNLLLIVEHFRDYVLEAGRTVALADKGILPPLQSMPRTPEPLSPSASEAVKVRAGFAREGVEVFEEQTQICLCELDLGVTSQITPDSGEISIWFLLLV